MQTRLPYRSLVVLMGLLLALAGCRSEPEKTPQASNDSAQPATRSNPYEWRDLFDGKTLANWKVTDFGGHGDAKVKDAMIIVPFGDPMSGITWDGPKDLPNINYEIVFEAQRVDGSDFFCALTFPVGQSHASLILGGWGGSVCGISSINGYDASENETSSGRTFEDKVWYRVRLRVMEDKIKAWLDEERLVDVVIKNKRVGTRIEVEVSKPLGFATYRTTGAYRGLKIRQLRDDEIETVKEEDLDLLN